MSPVVHAIPDRHIVSSFGQRSQCLSGVTPASPTAIHPILLIYLSGDAAQTGQDGYIEPSKSSDEIRQEPYSLPKEFEWSIIDIDDPKQVTYLVHTTPNFFFDILSRTRNSMIYCLPTTWRTMTPRSASTIALIF